MAYTHSQQCSGSIEPCRGQPVVPGMLCNHPIGTGMPFYQPIVSGMPDDDKCSISGSLFVHWQVSYSYIRQYVYTHMHAFIHILWY